MIKGDEFDDECEKNFHDDVTDVEVNLLHYPSSAMKRKNINPSSLTWTAAHDGRRRRGISGFVVVVVER